MKNYLFILFFIVIFFICNVTARRKSFSRRFELRSNGINYFYDEILSNNDKNDIEYKTLAEKLETSTTDTSSLPHYTGSSVSSKK